MKLLPENISQDLFNSVDLHFAAFIRRVADAAADPDVLLAAAMVSRATAEGHVCLDLASQRDVFNRLPLDLWRQKLRQHPAVGAPGEVRPLILDFEDRIYLYRYWHYESSLAGSLRQRAAGWLDKSLFNPLKTALAHHFPDNGGGDWRQQAAAVVPCCKKFCVVSGGPGTGKTFTVKKTLALLKELFGYAADRIFLAAPTGKAAARLKESIRAAPVSGNICGDTASKGLESLPSETYTLHRLLQPIRGTADFRYSIQNRLPADVVVVDEASMVDLALMAKLTAALPDECRLILLGDKDQLASVEAGSVLGDICNRAQGAGYSADFTDLMRQMTGAAVQESKNSATGPAGHCRTVSSPWRPATVLIPKAFSGV